MKFLTSGEQLLPGGLTHSTVSLQAVVALEPLNSGGSPGAELSVRADLLPQCVELLLDEPDGAAGHAGAHHDAGIGHRQPVFCGLLCVEDIPGVCPDFAVHVHIVPELEFFHGVFAPGAKATVYGQCGVIAALVTYAVQPGLHQRLVRAVGALLDQRIISGDRHCGHTPSTTAYAALWGGVP